MLFPELARFTDVALLLLRVMVGIVFITSGWKHLRDPEARSKDIEQSKGVTIFLGAAELAGGLGVMLAWLFMEDRTRNLSALGFIHGFLGSTFGKMFNGADAGALRVNYRVGPWNVEDPAAHALIVPVLCLAGIFALSAWCWRRLPSEPLPATSCSPY